MASDMEQGLKKTLSLSKQATELTSDIMKEMMKTFLSGNAEKKGVACHAKRKKLTRKTKKTLLNTTFKSVFYYL